MKTESQHTPGPWRISAPDKERVGDWGKRSLFYKSGIDGKYMGFIVFNPSSCDDNEAEANAQLIASAPDLLAVLQKTGYELQEWADHWDREADSFDHPAMEPERRLALARRDEVNSLKKEIQSAINKAKGL